MHVHYSVDEKKRSDTYAGIDVIRFGRSSGEAVEGVGRNACRYSRKTAQERQHYNFRFHSRKKQKS